MHIKVLYCYLHYLHLEVTNCYLHLEVTNCYLHLEVTNFYLHYLHLEVTNCYLYYWRAFIVDELFSFLSMLLPKTLHFNYRR